MLTQIQHGERESATNSLFSDRLFFCYRQLLITLRSPSLGKQHRCGTFLVYFWRYLFIVPVVGVRKRVKWHLLSLFLQSENATWATLSRDQCLNYGGDLVGEACGFVPDITLMSFILFFGTYACSMALKQFKTSRFFPTTVSGDPLGGVRGVVFMQFCYWDTYTLG